MTYAFTSSEKGTMYLDREILNSGKKWQSPVERMGRYYGVPLVQ